MRKANSTNINRIMEIKSDAVSIMASDKNNQWDDNHPTKDSFITYINRRELYVYEDNNKIQGMICLTELEDDEYKPVKWSISGKQIIIHRLAVAKDYTGMGIAKKLFTFAFDYAKKENVQIIKIDTFSKNKRAQKLFTSLGFNYVGDINFPQRPEPYYCYELVL